MQLNTRKMNNPIKVSEELKDTSPKKTYRWLINTWKYAQHHLLLEKCKSKPQWGIISRQSEWPPSKSLQTINAGEGVGKREPSYTVSGNANWYSHYGEQCLFLKKLGIELPYDPAIALLGIYTEGTRNKRDTCTPMLITALFTIAKTWKQPRCP